MKYLPLEQVAMATMPVRLLFSCSKAFVLTWASKSHSDSKMFLQFLAAKVDETFSRPTYANLATI